MANLSAADKAAIKATADRLGLDPYSFGAIIAKESSFNPNIWGGAGGNYYGLIQFGGPERREAGLDPEKIKKKSYTISEQLPAVERWLRGRGFETGMGPQKAYATILGGNPNANINAPDANNTTVANTTASLLPGGELYKYSQTVLGPFDGSNTDVSLMSTNAPQRQTVDQVLSKLRYDPAEYRKTDNKATSLRDQFVNSLKEQLINNVLNPLGGLFQ
jgi:hypothetical protein